MGPEEIADRIDALRVSVHQQALDRTSYSPHDALRGLLIELNKLTQSLRAPKKATVILFKPSGKYYTQEEWTIPDSVPDHSELRGAFKRKVVGPYDLRHSPDFRRIGGGAVLVPEQEPWGYPHLFPAEA